jgi:PII-like signaling protein
MPHGAPEATNALAQLLSTSGARDAPGHQSTITSKRGEMNATYLRFYVHENVRHRHQLLYEWLLQRAQAMGVHGGSVFRAVEGFGRHGVLHSQHFFELAGEMTMEVEFILTDEMADCLLGSLREEDLSLVYARLPAEFGVVGKQAHGSRIPID